MKKINVASTHLCPSISLRSHQSTYDPPPVFISQCTSFVFLGLCNSFFSSNHASAFFPHPHSLLSVLLFHSFIFYCLNSNRQNRPIELELFLIIIFLPASICIPLAFLPLGILLLSLPLSPCTPPSLYVGAFLSLPFFFLPSSLMCASLLSLSPPPKFVLSSLFLSFSLSLSPVSFCFPPQSLVMRCDKPLPCYHSNRVPVATQRRWCLGVRWPQFSTNTFNFLTLALTKSTKQ